MICVPVYSKKRICVEKPNANMHIIPTLTNFQKNKKTIIKPEFGGNPQVLTLHNTTFKKLLESRTNLQKPTFYNQTRTYIDYNKTLKNFTKAK